jgi:hypothetical protein
VRWVVERLVSVLVVIVCVSVIDDVIVNAFVGGIRWHKNVAAVCGGRLVGRVSVAVRRCSDSESDGENNDNND